MVYHEQLKAYPSDEAILLDENDTSPFVSIFNLPEVVNEEEEQRTEIDGLYSSGMMFLTGKDSPGKIPKQITIPCILIRFIVPLSLDTGIVFLET